ncbi:MAG TPA: MOSC domain-containing protein [Rhodocyclaceae bacterium]|nr:MOSC domain-containing protein [Rhodocyclaceae bacterium]
MRRRIATVDRLFVGGLRPLAPEGQLSGIFKAPVAGPVHLGHTGLDGDEQGDRRHHGGVEKALHHYPAEHYDAFARRWPGLAGQLAAGVLGENVSTRGLTEHDVCIGDVFGIGGCRVQVSQPRVPCWKINHRLDVSGASAFIAETGVTGWYYRVLEPGPLAAQDAIELLERPCPQLSLAHYWQTIHAHRPDVAELRAIAAAPGLAPDKAARLRERADWLERNAGRGG